MGEPEESAGRLGSAVGGMAGAGAGLTQGGRIAKFLFPAAIARDAAEALRTQRPAVAFRTTNRVIPLAMLVLALGGAVGGGKLGKRLGRRRVPPSEEPSWGQKLKERLSG